ncbi:MAG TPA: GNAT family N-acetyltransferase [Chloroflexota bacterium]|jgi:GNAT superfamily N-acetyltransferase|nr:GNAT family N-acetyltransferase [Chloroflexota bacterium]
MTITVRQRVLEDDPAIVDIRNTTRSWFPPTSLEEYRWQADPANSVPEDITERWVAERDGQVVGICVLSSMLFVEREATFAANIGVAIGSRRQGIGSRLSDQLMERAGHHKATRLYSQISEDFPEAEAFAERRGFTKTGRAQRMSRLLVADANLDGYDGVVERLEQGGIVIKTLAETGRSDRLLRAVFDMSFTAARDIPSTEEFSAPPFELWLKWLDSPGSSDDLHWIAFDGEKIVGTALVARRGDNSSFNNYTGVDREYRGRGIARALKFKTIEWARANDIDSIFTANDFENKPMLSINIPLGYEPVPAELEVVKDI